MVEENLGWEECGWWIEAFRSRGVALGRTRIVRAAWGTDDLEARMSSEAARRGVAIVIVVFMGG